SRAVARVSCPSVTDAAPRATEIRALECARGAFARAVPRFRDSKEPSRGRARLSPPAGTLEEEESPPSIPHRIRFEVGPANVREGARNARPCDAQRTGLGWSRWT